MLEAVGERLFAQDVLAGLGGGDGHRRMPVVPGADVHGVKLLGGQHILDGGVGVRDAEALREALRPLQIEVGDGDDLRLVAHRVRGHMGIRGDIAGADDADANLFHSCNHSFLSAPRPVSFRKTAAIRRVRAFFPRKPSAPDVSANRTAYVFPILSHNIRKVNIYPIFPKKILTS